MTAIVLPLWSIPAAWIVICWLIIGLASLRAWWRNRRDRPRLIDWAREEWIR